MQEAFALAFVFSDEVVYEEDETPSTVETAQADGPYAEHADTKTSGSNQVGQSALALRLQSLRLGMGSGPLEQVKSRKAKSVVIGAFRQLCFNAVSLHCFEQQAVSGSTRAG